MMPPTATAPSSISRSMPLVPASGLDSSSTTRSSSGRPPTPPAALISSTASCMPSRTCTPHGVNGPVNDVRVPMMIGSPDGASAAAVVAADESSAAAVVPGGSVVVANTTAPLGATANPRPCASRRPSSTASARPSGATSSATTARAATSSPEDRPRDPGGRRPARGRRDRGLLLLDVEQLQRRAPSARRARARRRRATRRPPRGDARPPRPRRAVDRRAAPSRTARPAPARPRWRGPRTSQGPASAVSRGNGLAVVRRRARIVSIPSIAFVNSIASSSMTARGLKDGSAMTPCTRRRCMPKLPGVVEREDGRLAQVAVEVVLAVDGVHTDDLHALVDAVEQHLGAVDLAHRAEHLAVVVVLVEVVARSSSRSSARPRSSPRRHRGRSPGTGSG